MTSTGCPVGADPFERFTVQIGGDKRYVLLSQRAMNVLYPEILTGLLDQEGIFAPSPSTYAEQGVPPGQS